MKKTVFIATLALLVSTGAQAQTNQGNGQNNQGNMNGGMQTPPSDPKKCTAEIPKLQSKADACLPQKDFAKRQQCFDAIGKSYPNGFLEGCGPVLEPLKQAIMSKEHSLYPNQASALGGNNGPNNGPNGGPNNGPGQMNGGMPVPPSDPAKCSAEIPKLQSKASTCLPQKDFAKRQQCFDAIGKSYPNGFLEGCGPILEPVKQSVMAKEHALYPNQASALGGNNGPNNGPNGGPNNGPNGGQNNMANMPKVDCAKIAADVKKAADKCLPTKSQPKRKACFDAVGQSVEKAGAGAQCSATLDPIKAEYQGKESAAYPGEPASIN